MSQNYVLGKLIGGDLKWNGLVQFYPIFMEEGDEHSWLFVANFFKNISDQGEGFLGEVTLRVELEDKDWWEKE